MTQEKEYFAFISYNSKDTEWGKKIQKKLALFHGKLNWIRSAFLDEPSGCSTTVRLFPKGLKKAERKEGAKGMRRYTLLSNIGSSAHEVGLMHHEIRFGRQITNDRQKT